MNLLIKELSMSKKIERSFLKHVLNKLILRQIEEQQHPLNKTRMLQLRKNIKKEQRKQTKDKLSLKSIKER